MPTLPLIKEEQIAFAQSDVNTGRSHILVVGLHPVFGWMICCPYRSANLSDLTNRITITR